MGIKTKTKFLDPLLHKRAKQKADKVYARHSAYKSMYMVKLYKDYGGRFSSKLKKGSAHGEVGVKRWNKERWIQVIPYLESGKISACGGDGGVRKKKVCRPLIRVNKETPITINEVIDKIGKKEMLRLAKKKVSDMDGRIFWKTQRFYSSG